MIQYLQRLKHKKGFTLVELAVVVGIIVVLTAIIMVNMLGGDTCGELQRKGVFYGKPADPDPHRTDRTIHS